jgi:hypothetical protein
MWSLARRDPSILPQEIQDTHYYTQEEQMLNIVEMKDGRYTRPYDSADTSADIKKIPVKIPTIGENWTTLAA